MIRYGKFNITSNNTIRRGIKPGYGSSRKFALFDEKYKYYYGSRDLCSHCGERMHCIAYDDFPWSRGEFNRNSKYNRNKIKNLLDL